MKQNPNTKMPEKVYKVYTARMRQTSTNAPTVRQLLHNTYGIDFTWTYAAGGNFRFNTANGEEIFTETNTGMFWSLNDGGWVVMEYNSPTQLIIRTLNTGGSSANGVMFDGTIEIRTYS